MNIFILVVLIVISIELYLILNNLRDIRGRVENIWNGLFNTPNSGLGRLDYLNYINANLEDIKSHLFKYLKNNSSENTEFDELYPEVKKFTVKEGKVSSPILQRKYGIGYSRADKLIETLENEGIIGPNNDSGVRVVI